MKRMRGLALGAIVVLAICPSMYSAQRFSRFASRIGSFARQAKYWAIKKAFINKIEATGAKKGLFQRFFPKFRFLAGVALVAGTGQAYCDGLTSIMVPLEFNKANIDRYPKYKDLFLKRIKEILSNEGKWATDKKEYADTIEGIQHFIYMYPDTAKELSPYVINQCNTIDRSIIKAVLEYSPDISASLAQAIVTKTENNGLLEYVMKNSDALTFNNSWWPDFWGRETLCSKVIDYAVNNLAKVPYANKNTIYLCALNKDIPDKDLREQFMNALAKDNLKKEKEAQ